MVGTHARVLRNVGPRRMVAVIKMLGLLKAVGFCRVVKALKVVGLIFMATLRLRHRMTRKVAKYRLQ